jgi:predicted PurR-regulated permease PerM
MRVSVQGVFVSTGKILIGHCLFTWIWFSFFSIKYLYLYTLIAGILAVLPIVSPWMLCILPSITLYMSSNDNGFLSITLFIAVYFLAMNLIDGLLYETDVRASSYLFGLSVALGVYAFGINGFIYGPLLVCSLQILYDAFKLD